MMYSSIVVIYSFPRIPPDHTLSTHESGFFSLLQIQCRITYTKVKNKIVIWYEKIDIESFGFGNSSSWLLYVCIKGSRSQPQSVQSRPSFLYIRSSSYASKNKIVNTRDKSCLISDKWRNEFSFLVDVSDGFFFIFEYIALSLSDKKLSYFMTVIRLIHKPLPLLLWRNKSK